MDKPEGFCCTRAGFLDTCKVMLGNMGILGAGGGCVLFTLEDAPGEMPAEGERLEQNLTLLENILQANLRKGDFYTRWSRRQFCAVLLDDGEETYETALRGIRQVLRQDSHIRVRVSCAPLDQLCRIRGTESFRTYREQDPAVCPGTAAEEVY